MTFRFALAHLGLALLACSALGRPQASADAPALEARLGYVAFGGPGVTACRDATCLDREYRVLGVVTLRNRTTSARSGFESVRVEVLRSDGTVASTSREVAELVVVPAGVPDAETSFAPGATFDGSLRPGTTTLRFQTWMTHRPADGARVRVVFGSASGTVTVEGTLPPYEWPT